MFKWERADRQRLGKRGPSKQKETRSVSYSKQANQIYYDPLLPVSNSDHIPLMLIGLVTF